MTSSSSAAGRGLQTGARARAAQRVGHRPGGDRPDPPRRCRSAGAQPVEPAVGRRPAMLDGPLLSPARLAAAAERATSGPYFEPAKRVALMRGILERLGVARSRARGHGNRVAGDTATPGRRRSRSKGGRPIERDLAIATPISVTPGLFSGIRHATRVRAACWRIPTTSVRRARWSINETLMRTYFTNGDPVGRRFRFVNGRGQVPAQRAVDHDRRRGGGREARMGSMPPSVRRSINRCCSPPR